MKDTEPTEEEKNSKDPDIKRSIVPIRRLKRYLVKHFQENLQKNGVSPEKSKVADICFAFNNR